MALADSAALQAVRDWCNATFAPRWKTGDSFYVYWHGAGVCTSSATQVLFSLPLDRPIKSGCTAKMTYTSTQGYILRSNGNYSHGSAASTYVRPTSTTCTVRDGYIDIVATFSTTTNAQNNAPIAIALVGNITIS